MNTNNLTIEVKHRSRAQPGPYQPHVYESDIKITGSKSWDRLTEDQIRRLAKVVVHWWPEDEERKPDMAGHFQPSLNLFKKIDSESLSEATLGPQYETWRVRVEIPFTD